MQNLEQILSDAKKNNLPVLQMLNTAREYLQVQILKALYQSPYKKSLSFMGGTCLRICHGLKRYSEDLAFALDKKMKVYSFRDINAIALRFLKQRGFEADLHVKEEKTVHKSFIRVREILPRMGKGFRENQKLHIKLEVDTNPVRVTAGEIETHFVVKFDENFPLLKHTDEVLFAGKVLAVMNRVYTKGRDFYDLIWYLKRRTGIDLEYLNRGLRQAHVKFSLKDIPSVFEALRKKVGEVSGKEILSDCGPFLADPSEREWLNRYPEAFEQMAAAYLSKNTAE